MTETGSYPLSVIIEHLKGAIPNEHQHLVEASSTISEIWARLDEKFGDRVMTILSVQRSLTGLDLSRLKEYDKVEKLHDEISKALRLLTPLNAQDCVTKDLQLVSKLVDKLPETLQLEWSRQATKPGAQILPGVNEWPYFMAWLNEERKAALHRRNYQLARGGLDQRLITSAKPFCSNCGKLGHKPENCYNKTTLADINIVDCETPDDPTSLDTCAFASSKDREEAYKRAEIKAGKCPICKLPHTYKRPEAGSILDWPSHHLNTCPKFSAMTPFEKGKKVEELTACPKCTSYKHQIQHCPRRGLTCNRIENGQRCRRKHADVLHDS